MIIKGLREKSLCQVMSLNLPFIMVKFLFQVFVMGRLHTKDFLPEWNLMLMPGEETKWVGIKAKEFILFVLC